MIVNGHRLPDSLEQCIRTEVLQRARGSWQLQTDCDAYGNPLETELSEVFTTSEDFEVRTARLTEDFAADGDYGENDSGLQGPGAIPDILDFAAIICFGVSGDGSPFCLDYRENEIVPSVVWWDDCYWRRVAPDFDSFLNLLDMDS